jgi:hypothetical protein
MVKISVVIVMDNKLKLIDIINMVIIMIMDFDKMT